MSVLSALMVLGATDNFIDQATVNILIIPMQPLQHPLCIHAIEGVTIGDSKSCIQPLLQVSLLHQEHIFSGHYYLKTPNHSRVPLDVSK